MGPLRPFTIAGDLIPVGRLRFPVLAVRPVAPRASAVRDAAELRIKEKTDRLA